MKDISMSLRIEQLAAIEEKHVIKRYQSPSIVDALRVKHALKMILFCSAIFFKYRAVNKRIQLYDD